MLNRLMAHGSHPSREFLRILCIGIMDVLDGYDGSYDYKQAMDIVHGRYNASGMSILGVQVIQRNNNLQMPKSAETAVVPS